MPRSGRLAAVLPGFLLSLAFCAAQQTPTRPKKVLTPEQKAYQQQWKDWFANHQKLQAQAKQIFSDEMSREKAGDCADAQTTVDFEFCFAKANEVADTSLKSYEEVIRQLLAPAPQMPGVPANRPGPAGPSLTSAQWIDELNHLEETWQNYLKVACAAALDQFGGGTGGPPFEQECTLKLTRDHMRELDMIYGIALHL